MLTGLALLMLTEAWQGIQESAQPLFHSGTVRMLASVAAGLGIGMVAALMGVAELTNGRIWTPSRMQARCSSANKVRLLTYIRPLTAAPY